MNHLAVLETFFSLSVQVAVLIGLTSYVARRRRIGADADACWAIAHACILLLAAAAFTLPHVRLVTWADFQPSGISPIVETAVFTASRICTWIWLSGTIAALVVCVGGMIRATYLVRRAAVDERIGQIAEELAAGEWSGSRIETRVSADNVSPFCWQFHRPVIVLPEVVRNFPPAEQAAILRHERAHIRLQHPLHLFLQRIVEAILWFHPFVWWASRQAAAAREFRCDRDAVRTRHEVADYLRSLLRLIESRVKPPGRLPTGIGFVGDGSLLSRRASVLGEYVEPPMAPTRVRRAAIAIALGSLICGVVWLPTNPLASRRSAWSPWPAWSARVLSVAGIIVRDYEIDGHRLSLNEREK